MGSPQTVHEKPNLVFRESLRLGAVSIVVCEEQKNAMFTIALKQELYPTYILSDQSAQARLEVVPERGGIITAWRIQGQNFLYFDRDRFADPSLSIRGGIPILFPICGNLPNDLYVHKSKSYHLKQHGFARDLPWEVSDRITSDGAGLILTLRSTEQTRAQYPFDFELQFTYLLKGNSLKINQLFINHSDDVMPFATGLHPYFNIQDKKRLSFDIPAPQKQDHITQTMGSFSGSFDVDAEEVDVALFPVQRPTASMTNHRHNVKLTMRYSDIYSTLVFWTVKGKDYCCLEPWSAPRNALNSKDKLVYLDPGTSCQASVEFTVSYLKPPEPATK